MSVIENIVNTLNWIYQYIPKELVIVILGSMILFVILELGDRKRKKEWLKEQKQLQKNRKSRES
jgi:hypothetical protein|tara:strand:+ start:2245 stop:2436 length:192 start_codon:yes stop_codon:yes gene_type:complete